MAIPAEQIEGERRQWDFFQRHALLLVGAAPMAANMLGSVFNIWYNATQIEPMLSEAQLQRFHDCWMVFNLVIYPLAGLMWFLPLIWLMPSHRAMLAGEPVEPERLVRAQRTVVNLPWWILAVASASWLLCIPVFPASLMAVGEPLSMDVVWHLVTAFVTGGLIAITHSFFAVELVSQRTLFPVFFRRENPAEIPRSEEHTSELQSH